MKESIIVIIEIALGVILGLIGFVIVVAESISLLQWLGRL